MIAQRLAAAKTLPGAGETALATGEAPASGLRPARQQVALGDCSICGEVIAAARDMKTLPCKHSFHFACIDDFHRQKLREEKNPDLPCYTCGVASNKSIASVMEERRKKREEDEERKRLEQEQAAGCRLKPWCELKQRQEVAEERVPASHAAAAAAAAAARRGRGGALSALARASK
eukprot:TRINITY_DN34518_c0_g1_i2.p1 TRINITY_DN34518_c0_g1~~TRINITY_DN34518_c0_g1_i2.p1  ORF type:complete len:176 (+),score=36.00 TRINITY_DN34518_c0_g1_i2:160-687(+)